MTPTEPPVPVIYVAGVGRSGSTLLDVILDNHQAVIGVGELMNLVSRGYLRGHYCACGAVTGECPFWSEVRRAWVQRSPGLDLGAYARLQRQFERYTTLPRVLRESVWRSTAFTVYAAWTAALFQVVRQVSGRPVIVDSSKIPARAAALALIPELDVRILHLVRDGRAVAYSLKQPYRKNLAAGLPRDVEPAPVWRTAVLWAAANLQVDAVRRLSRLSGSMRLRYEDLTADFPRVAARLGRLADLDLTDLARRLTAGEELRIGHTVEGNRLRMLGRVQLRPDLAWMTRLSIREQRVFWSIAGWLSSRYGYRADGSLAPDGGSGDVPTTAQPEDG